MYKHTTVFIIVDEEDARIKLLKNNKVSSTGDYEITSIWLKYCILVDFISCAF